MYQHRRGEQQQQRLGMTETSRRIRSRAGRSAVDRPMIYCPAATGEATDHSTSSGEQSPSFLLLSSNSAKITPVPRSENVALRID